jgi:hypothetical protein
MGTAAAEDYGIFQRTFPDREANLPPSQKSNATPAEI